VFCDKFFSSGRFLNDIANNGPKRISDFGDPRLRSYEQMMVHEWMHSDVMGYQGHSKDPNAKYATSSADHYFIVDDLWAIIDDSKLDRACLTNLFPGALC